MGVDYYAKSIIGVRIPNPTVKKQVRGCEHPESKAKFCPECGKPMYFQEEGYHPIIEALDEYDSKKVTKLKLVWSTDQEEAYVGFFKGGSDSSRSGGANEAAKVDLPDINIQELKDALQKELKELYNEKNFGLWTILYCSY
jgi:hypothetical protein